MTTDRPPVGIALMLGFCCLIPFSDAIAKILGARFPIAELVAVRFSAQFLLLAPIAWLSGQSLRLEGRILWLAVLRTLLHILGLGGMFLALRYLPLADAVAIAFVLPFISLLLGWLVLNETVGTRRLVACAVGFCGTLLVVQPSFAEVGAPALLPLGVALVFALFLLITRQISQAADPVALQATSGAIACALLAPVFLWGAQSGHEPLALLMPAGGDLALFALLGLFGTGAHLLMTWAYRFAPTATLAPMQYIEIPVATSVGWLVFRDFPNGLAFMGIAITIGAGLYIIARERSVSRAMKRASAATG
ncbi:MAG: DMT family transporter [Alphaproteobacteria bacterium]|nr:DMT family transporter [Alphaproteobacteria bacterium]NNF24009.1 DMT family transporter [Paracoccaceae bacterium]